MNEWHPNPNVNKQDRDLTGPYWAEVERRRFHQMPMEDADLAWYWRVCRLGLGAGPGHTIVASGAAPSEPTAKQAVSDWLAAHPIDDALKLWNVAVPVVASLRAHDGPEAYKRLTGALKAAGFDIYDDHPYEPFESEDGPQESDPPLPAGWPW